MASSEAVRAAQTPLPAGLVHMWINRGQNGFGIYFKHAASDPTGQGLVVSKIDPNSEASRSDVQVGDELVLVNDIDVRFKDHNATLAMIREQQSCKMTFIPGTAF